MRLPSDIALTNARRTLSKRTSIPAAEPPQPAVPAEEATSPADGPVTPVESANEDIADITRLSGRVRFARTLAGLSKAELARRVGVCLSAAVQWELVKGTSPTVSNIIKIATIAGVGFEWIATGRGSPKLADGMHVLANAADLEFEMRLLVAARAIARDRREVVIDFARSLADR
ncbi:MAG: helix-turn-helix transcriptional regulator [Rhodanobacteraceae bacterium]